MRQIARLDDLVAAQTAERRLNMLMFSLFGLLGLVISAVGIFGVIAYLVSQQTRDIGIRMALGATRWRVVAGVLGHAGGPVTAGLVTGGLAAWSLSNLAGRFLFGLDPRDARAYAVAMIALLAALIATVLPARRAASINPIDALRNEQKDAVEELRFGARPGRIGCRRRSRSATYRSGTHSTPIPSHRSGILGFWGLPLARSAVTTVRPLHASERDHERSATDLLLSVFTSWGTSRVFRSRWPESHLPAART